MTLVRSTPTLARVLAAGLSLGALACASSSADTTAAAPAPSSAPRAEPAAATPAPAASAGLFTTDQADRGESTYDESCAACHASSEFQGRQFEFAWGRRTVGDLYRHISDNMPEDNPGSLTPQQYVDVVAYILELNGFPRGDRELPPDEETLKMHPLANPSGS